MVEQVPVAAMEATQAALTPPLVLVGQALARRLVASAVRVRSSAVSAGRRQLQAPAMPETVARHSATAALVELRALAVVEVVSAALEE
jgi:hypothetical protein